MWLKRLRNEAYRVTGKPPISFKWVDVNKRDDLNPNYRSRLVARDIRRPGKQAIFAPTPPLGALRTVLSAAATDRKDAKKKHIRNPEPEHRTQISPIDVPRAYFNAKRDPDADPVCVGLRHATWSDYFSCICTVRERQPMVGIAIARDCWGSLGSQREMQALAYSNTH